MGQDWRLDLELIWGTRLRRDEPMAGYTSFGIGGPADALLEIREVDDLCAAARWAASRGVPCRVIGAGSNLLVADDGVAGLVIVNHCDAIRIIESEDTATVQVEAGKAITALARELARAGWAGLEWAVGLPGTVGGAIVGNAGARARSMADCIIRVQILDEHGEHAWVSAAELGFRYRSSSLKQSGRGLRIVLAAEMAFQRGDPAQIEAAVREIVRTRKLSQPLQQRSAGSVFKNPASDYAGRMIEAVGLKGQRIGDAQVSPKHANFIVNLGAATSGDVLDLIGLIRDRVRERFHQELELEIVCLGRHTHPEWL